MCQESLGYPWALCRDSPPPPPLPKIRTKEGSRAQQLYTRWPTCHLSGCLSSVSAAGEWAPDRLEARLSTGSSLGANYISSVRLINIQKIKSERKQDGYICLFFNPAHPAPKNQNIKYTILKIRNEEQASKTKSKIRQNQNKLTLFFFLFFLFSPLLCVLRGIEK